MAHYEGAAIAGGSPSRSKPISGGRSPATALPAPWLDPDLRRRRPFTLTKGEDALTEYRFNARRSSLFCGAAASRSSPGQRA